MASGDPLAVAFVEVRPEVDDFRSNAEEELRAGDALVVDGKVSLDTEQARREIESLQQEVRAVGDVSAQQLQFQGLGLEGLDAASEEVAALSESAGSLGDTLGTSATAVSALIARQEQLSRSSGELRANLRAEQQELRETAEDERRLIRVRSGRAAGVAGLRFAGVGLAAGTALFATTRAVRELGTALEVTGDEASTFEGKTRNAFSALISGDLVGVFAALTNDTRTYSREQLVLLNQTPQLAEALRELGEAGNLARSTTEALAGLTQAPQFLQTAFARESAQGDVSGQIEALEEQLAFFKEAERIANEIAESDAQRNAILEPIFQSQAKLREQLADLRSGGAAGGATTRAPRATAGAALVDQLTGELSALEREQAKLRESLPRGESAGAELEDLREQLASVNRKIEEETGRVRAEQERHVRDLQGEGGVGLEARFTQFALAEIDLAELRKLQSEAARLERAIDRKEVEAGGLADAKDRLKEVNDLIEQTVQAIKDEQARHAEEMRGKALQQLRIDTLEAELFGSEAEEAAALQAEEDAINRQLANKKISADERERLLGELASIDARQEAAADAIAAEAEQHARDVQEAQDRSDQAFLDAIDDRQRRANRNRIRIEASAQLTDDIRLSEDLQDIFRQQIAAARKTINDQRLKQQTIADLTEQLAREEQNEATLRREQRRTALERREEGLDLDIELAAAQDNERKEIRAHQAKIAYLQERIRHTREGTNQRKRLRVEIAQERAEIKRLEEELKEEAKEDEGGSFDQIAASFLEELQGFSATFGSNVLPPGGGAAFPGMQAPSARQFEPPPVAPPITVFDVPSPFEDRRGAGVSQADVAAQLRADRGAPVSQGQGNELIELTKATNRLLRDIKSGLGHTEAATSRRLARHTVETSAD